MRTCRKDESTACPLSSNPDSQMARGQQAEGQAAFTFHGHRLASLYRTRCLARQVFHLS